MSARSMTKWPPELASIGAIRFARRYQRFHEAVRFYRDLVGLPLYETFEESYGANGAIFAMPTTAITFEIVEASEPVAVDPHEQLCLYFPDEEAKQAAIARLTKAGVGPVESHPYWAATGAVTYRDPEGREVVFAPFVYGTGEPPASVTEGKHEFPSA
jgi:Glyoxalase/Bleomycin resistance protein/Dioxygenase superfamily